MPAIQTMTTRTTLLCAGLLLSPVLVTHSAAALIAGDIAIIGFTDNGAPDSFVVTTLAPLAAGEIIYFTDNGWTGSGFRGAGTDGDGNENLIALTIDVALPAGAVLTSPVNTASVTWTASGAIPGAATGTFANLAIAGGGDQITAFQGPTSNPLASPTASLYLMHNASDVFTPATVASETAIPPGLSIAAGTVAHLGPTPAPDFFGGSFGLDGTDPDVANLQTNGGTQSQWLAVIADRDNWLQSAAALPSLNVLPVPEPGSSALAALAAGLLLRRRR